MDLQKPFSYQFEDTQWLTKLGLGALITLVPILNFAVAGYVVQIVQNVASGASEPLPQWDDFGEKFRDGLILAVAALIYTVPILVFLCLPLSVLIASGILSSNSDLKDVASALAAVGGVTLLCLFGLFMLYALVLSIIRPIILVIFSRERTLAACFRFGEIWKVLTNHPGPFFTTWGVVILAGLAVGIIVGFITLVVGWIPCLGGLVSVLLSLGTTIYLVTADAYLFGEFRRVALDGAPAPASPAVP
ncbi:MAG TPA: DUF4013 domain-containing protein [Anaerolineales bacterium]|nr:DUF4013 domain-containing protein [Anaerolineales bacterium]